MAESPNRGLAGEVPADPFAPGGSGKRAASLGVTVMSLESAIFQWQQGERRLRSEPAERTARLERVTEALVAELRRRLGGRFTSEELVELYRQGTVWCLQVAMKVAPEDPWAWEAGTVVDAAFARYLREASDYAGGRTQLREA